PGGPPDRPGGPPGEPQRPHRTVRPHRRLAPSYRGARAPAEVSSRVPTRNATTLVSTTQQGADQERDHPRLDHRARPQTPPTGLLTERAEGVVSQAGPGSLGQIPRDDHPGRLPVRSPCRV